MAQGDGNRCIRNAPYRITFPIVNTSGVLQSGASGLDSEESQDGATFTDCDNEATEIGSAGIYTLDLTATEMTGDELAAYTISSGNPTVWHTITPEPALDSGVAQGGAAGSITLRASASGTADYYNGAEIEIVRGTGAGQLRTITDYSAAQVATVDRNWATNPDSTSVYIIHPKVGLTLGTDIVAHANLKQIADNATAATNMETLYQGGLIATSVNDASPTTTSWIGAAGLSATDDFYNGALVVFTSGTLLGLARKITDYVGSTLTITTSAFPSAPGNGDEFVIISRIE